MLFVNFAKDMRHVIPHKRLSFNKRKTFTALIIESFLL